MLNIKKLRSDANLTQKEFGEKIGLNRYQTISKYEKDPESIPVTVQKLIRYEFAEFLPEEERLAVATASHPTQSQDSPLQELKAENEQLKKRVADLEQDKEDLRKDKEMLQLHIKTLTGTTGNSEQSA